MQVCLYIWITPLHIVNFHIVFSAMYDYLYSDEGWKKGSQCNKIVLPSSVQCSSLLHIMTCIRMFNQWNIMKTRFYSVLRLLQREWNDTV